MFLKPLAITLCAGGAGLVLAVSSPAIAQDATGGEPADQFDTPKVIDKLFECRSIADPEARLACFDREVGAVYQARESKELVIAEREQLDEAKRGLFGLNLPTLGLFKGGDDEDEISEVTTVLAGATKLRNGRHIFELENGARWIETGDASGFRKFKAGDTIVISKAAFGSFKAKVNGKRAVRVRRIN